MPTQFVVDWKLSRTIIAFIIGNIIAAVTWFTKLESRVNALEKVETNQTRWYPYTDWQLIRQDMNYLKETISEIRSDVKELKKTP